MTKIIQNTEKNISKSVKQTNPGINNQNWNNFSLKDPDTDRSSTLQKSFSNQNSRQRSLASNSSNNVYRKRPFSGLHKKTALFRATQIFQKVTKVVVNSQINVSFSPAPIWLSLSLLNLKYYLTYQKKICLNKSFCLDYGPLFCNYMCTWMCKKNPIFIKLL